MPRLEIIVSSLLQNRQDALNKDSFWNKKTQRPEFSMHCFKREGRNTFFTCFTTVLLLYKRVSP